MANSLEFPKHYVGIFRIRQEAIVTAVERFPFVGFYAEYRLEFFGCARIAKAEHGVLDDQNAAGLEYARQIGHRLLELGKADAMATLRRWRRNVQIPMAENCHGKNGIVAGAGFPLRRSGYSKVIFLSPALIRRKRQTNIERIDVETDDSRREILA